MVTAIVLMKADRKHIQELSQILADIPGVTEVYTVTGEYDFALMVRAKTNEEIGTVVIDQLNEVEGIIETYTMLALRCYSQHDLDAAFGLGIE